MTLMLRELEVGQLDAKHEWLNDLRSGTDYLWQSYSIPESVQLDDFYNGRKFYVTGLKGTGKTALLRYLASYFDREKGCLTKFVLFKSQISEQDKESFQDLPSISVIDESIETEDETEYELGWRWFIYRKIAQTMEEEERGPFVQNDAAKQFIATIKAPYIDKPQGVIAKLIPKMKSGNIELSTNAKKIAGKVGLQFEWADSGQKSVSFHALVLLADSLFRRLVPGPKKLYIFFDELELSYGSQSRFDRDCRILRDLVVSVGRINEQATEAGKPVMVIAATRSEVLRHVANLGKEINKLLSDFGFFITWHRSPRSALEHPLIDLVAKKIRVAEQIVLGKPETQDPWLDYFSQSSHGQDTKRFLLHNSWYRPRDFVRLLNIAKQQAPKARKFSQSVLDDAQRTYSDDSWIELTEELQPGYSPEEIAGIRQLFTGFSYIFTTEELMLHGLKRQVRYPSLKILFGSRDMNEVLQDLFRIGALGNDYLAEVVSGPQWRNRWAFRGDEHLLLDQRITVHRALRPTFSMV